MGYRKSHRRRWEGTPGQPVLSETEWLAICESVAKGREASLNNAMRLLEKRIQKIRSLASEELDARSQREAILAEHFIPEWRLRIGPAEFKKIAEEQSQESQRRRLAEENTLLAKLQLQWHRDLSSLKAQEIIGSAAEANDFDFFIRLGKWLATPVLSRDDLSPSNLTTLLLAEWVRRAPRRLGNFRNLAPRYPLAQDRIGLCFFTNRALTKYCNIQLGHVPQPRLTEDCVIQWRRRLGLKPARRKLITCVKLVQGQIKLS